MGTGKPKPAAAGVPAVASAFRHTLGAMGVKATAQSLAVINQLGGFDCPGCAWPEAAPADRHRIEFCESGAKAVAEEATKARITRAFFAEHTIDDLRGRSDYWLGRAGRLTEPMIKRPDSDHYTPIAWDDAFVHIARTLRQLGSPNQAVFYTSGRTSNEAAFAYQLMVRAFGTNNLPDCSNMCHEPTSFALQRSIGIGKGSVRLEDFEHADLILVVGQNPGSNHPRMLTTLEAAKHRGARIVAINPLPEAGLLRYKNPQTPRGLLGRGTQLADLHLPVQLGGDQALFQLWSAWLLARDAVVPGSIDRDFVGRHTSGFGAFARHLEGTDHAALLARTGLTDDQARTAFDMIARAERIIVCWAMGITQHVHAVQTIDEITNLILLGGHIGRVGAGLCPIRGHSNVQGDRTMGIFDKPDPTMLDALEATFGVTMPRKHGVGSVDAVRAFADGRARVLVSLGGNFVRAVPDSDAIEAAMAATPLTVHISTKLNRSHLECGRTSIILPTLGRTDRDESTFGSQFVTVEDSMGIVHSSEGVLDPPSPNLRSEVAIICDLAQALFGDQHSVPWMRWREDYDVLRDSIAKTITGFEDFNRRVREPGGFCLPHPPRDERRFPTADDRAQFTVTHAATVSSPPPLLLQTLRSHDQYNTTIYGHHDRYRAISGDRRVIMMNPDDVADRGLEDADIVDIVSLLPGPERRAAGYRIIAYPTPRGCAAAYFPETNVLMSLDHCGPESQTPAFKAVPIRVERATAAADEPTRPAHRPSP